jgi:hypothetical protein
MLPMQIDGQARSHLFVLGGYSLFEQTVLKVGRQAAPNPHDRLA